MLIKKIRNLFKKIFNKTKKTGVESLDLNNLPEVLLVDKQKGITSFDVIRNLRGHIGKVKMGHAGTLDPLATGLMLVGLQKGTKKLHELLGLPKTYIADILFGQKTDTGDLEGKIIEEKDVYDLKEEQVKDMLDEMVGNIDLKVPLYSAIKKDGKPLYWYARNGKPVEVPTKTMVVRKVAFLDLYKRDNKMVARVLFDVGSGTYIRSLAEELGRKLGVPATLAGLRRTKIGEYKIEDAIVVTDPRD